MKALSLKPEWAMPVMLGDKTVEWRSWSTSYRGPLLICASAQRKPGCISGHALCIVELLDVVPFDEDEHTDAALLEWPPDDGYAWMLGDVDWVEPVPVKGKLHLYDVPDDQIRIIPETIGDREAFTRYFLPLVYMGRNGSWRETWDQTLAEMSA